MSRLFASLLLAILLLCTVSAQAQASRLTDLEAALARGDVRSLSDYLADRVEVSLEGATSVYSRDQAAYVLRGFFEQYPPRSFRFEDVMEAGDGAVFASGRYEHARGRFSVMVRLGMTGRGLELRELRIE